MGIPQADRKKTVALSSTEAEYMGITETIKEAPHLIGFLKELGYVDLVHVTIYNDNRGVGLLASNSVFHSRSKHIDIRYHFFREMLRNHTVDLIYIPSERMIADVLTKVLPGRRHFKCVLGFGFQQIIGLNSRKSIEYHTSWRLVPRLPNITCECNVTVSRMEVSANYLTLCSH